MHIVLAKRVTQETHIPRTDATVSKCSFFSFLTCVFVQAHPSEFYKSSLARLIQSFMVFEIQMLMNAKSYPTHVEKETFV